MTFRQAVRTRRVGFFAATVLAAASANAVHAQDITANLRQSQANRLSYFHDYGISALGTTADSPPGAANNGGLVAPLLGSFASTVPEEPKPFFLSATPLAGYDSDPDGQNRKRNSVFAGFDLTGQIEQHVGDLDPIVGYPLEASLTYNAQGAVYEGQTQHADELQQSFTAAVRQSLFKNTLVLSGILADQFTVDQGRAFLNTVDFAPAAEIFALPQFSVEGVYDYTHFDYFYPVLASQDPDAERSAFTGLFHFYSFPQTRGTPLPESPDQLTDILRASLNRATVGFGHVWNFGEGKSYEYESNRVVFGLEGLKIREKANVTFDLQYAHEWQHYSRFNTETPVTINEKHGLLLRRDELDVVTLRANARLLQLSHNAGNINGFLQLDVVDNDSNVEPRSFDELIVSGGVTYRY